MLKEKIKKATKEAIENIKDRLNITEIPELIIEIPKNNNFGDFSINVSSLSKYAKMPPNKIGNMIIEKINLKDTKINVIGGFINFTLGKSYLKNIIEEILNKKEVYANNNLGENKKVILEYVSANPTGPFHIGHGRWAAVGSTLSNLLKMSNYNVYQEFYINDAGNQINNLGKSLYIRVMKALGENIDFPSDEIQIKNYYTGDYLVQVADKFISENIEICEKLKHDGLTTNNLEILMDYAKKELFKKQIETLKKFRTYFDNYFSELTLHKSGDVEKCVKCLENKNQLYQREGALWFKSSEYGDSLDRVIKKNDGTNTYLTADIAYHINKIERGFDHLINIWGADHHGYIARVKASLEALGYNPDCLEIILGQLVNLIIDGEQTRMGKRSKMLTLDDLIEEVGVDATRFWMIMRNYDSTLDFDVNLAKSSNDNNPVFYVQYAFARACSILRNITDNSSVDFNSQNLEQKKKNSILTKEELENLLINYKNFDLNLLFNDENCSDYKNTKKLLLKLEEIKSVVYSASKNRTPYIVCKYLQELSAIFHQFYNSTRVITDNIELTKGRIILIYAFIQIMRLGFSIIEITAVEKM